MSLREDVVLAIAAENGCQLAEAYASTTDRDLKVAQAQVQFYRNILENPCNDLGCDHRRCGELRAFGK